MGDGLAEQHGIGLDHATALGALGGHLLDSKLVHGPAGVAADAAELHAAAVDLGDGRAACLLVEVVDVLGDDVLKLAQLL